MDNLIEKKITYDYIEQFAKLYNKLVEHFKGDKELVNIWLTTSNAALGYMQPIQFISISKMDKLIEFVEKQLLHK